MHCVTVCFVMLLCSILLCVASTTIIEAFVTRREFHDHFDNYDNVTKVRQGMIRGCPMRARNGKEFMAFKGIRYANPPVGSLRFKVCSF